MARIRGTFTSTAGTVANPGSVKLVVTSPSGTDTVKTTTQLVHASTGVYYYDMLLTAPGRWPYQFTSTGAVSASGGDYLAVRPKFASTST